MKKIFFLAIILGFFVYGGCKSTDNKKVDATPQGDDGTEKKIKSAEQTDVAQKAASGKTSATTIMSSVPKEHNFPDFTKEYGGNDSCEGFNRSMFAVNKYGSIYVVQPIAIFWGSIIPKHGIECFNRFTDNVAFPKRTFSSLCQAKFKGAGIDFSRFLTNVTVGIAGFYDPATNWFDMEYQDEDFGQAFAVWGIGPGATLHLPSIGPTNVRDGVGKIFDYAFDPKTYITGGQGFTMLNEGTARYRELDIFFQAFNDPYELSKRLYSSERYVKINDYDYKAKMAEYQKQLMTEAKTIPGDLNPANPADPALPQVDVAGFKSQGPNIDTMRVGLVKIQNDNESMWVDVSCWNSDFFNQGSIRSVSVIKEKSDMPYKVWYQKDKNAPLAVILPGSGSHFTATSVTRMAEILHGEGYSVATLSNTMNWEFMTTAAATPTPGYTPADAEDVSNAIAAVINDLESNKKIKPSAKLLVGYSMGGLHTAFIGANEKNNPKLKFDRYIAINPPVDMIQAINEIDKTSQAWKKWQQDMVFQRGVLAATKFIGISKKPYKPFESPSQAVKINGKDVAPEKAQKDADKDATRYVELPFTNTEAQVMIGYTFKITLNEMVLSIVRNHPELTPPGVKYSWGSRTAFYRDINDMSFMDYVKTFVLKYYSEKDKHAFTLTELNDHSGLQAIQNYLRDDKNVFVIHTGNDLLEDIENRQWLYKTMGSRCTFYNAGGHLGNLYFKSTQNQLGKLAAELKVKK